MLGKVVPNKPRPTVEDFLRATAYAVLTLWAVLFLVFPPLAYQSEVDFWTRVGWMGITMAGGTLAFVGSITRTDIKMELPGIVFASLGPLFYFIVQIYFMANPLPDSLPNSRNALAAYAILPLLMMLPRLYGLHKESRRMKRAARYKTEVSTAEVNLPKGK